MVLDPQAENTALVFDHCWIGEYQYGMSELTRLRTALGLTQQQLADLVKTSQPQIKRLERGERKLTKQWAQRLAPHLKVTAEALMFPDAASPESGLDRLVARIPPELADDSDAAEAEDIREDYKRIKRRAERLLAKVHQSAD